MSVKRGLLHGLRLYKCKCGCSCCGTGLGIDGVGMNNLDIGTGLLLCGGPGNGSFCGIRCTGLCGSLAVLYSESTSSCNALIWSILNFCCVLVLLNISAIFLLTSTAASCAKIFGICP